MTTDALLADGFVRVERAIDPAFCEEVVRATFERMGLAEDDPATWPDGVVHLPVTCNWDLAEVAPAAMAAVHALVDPAEVAFAGVQDNLIVNLPRAGQRWWPPERWDAEGAG